MRYDSIFDVIGHIMVGPSSSHTAGACKIGLIVNKLFGPPKDVEIYLHGSFAETGFGHGTNKAIIAGLLGIEPDNEKLRWSYDLAKEKGMKFKFEKKNLGENYHPNSALIKFKSVIDTNLTDISVVGSSIGGGNIIIKEINEINAGFDGNASTILVFTDISNKDIKKTRQIIDDYKLKIINLSSDYKSDKKMALHWLEVNSNIPEDLINKLKSNKDIKAVRFFNV